MILFSVTQGFSITVLRVGSAVGVNGPVIFLSKGEQVKPSLRGNNLVTRYGFPKGSCVIPNKAAYMGNETWSRVMKVVAPSIRKMKAAEDGYIDDDGDA